MTVNLCTDTIILIYFVKRKLQTCEICQIPQLDEVISVTVHEPASPYLAEQESEIKLYRHLAPPGHVIHRQNHHTKKPRKNQKKLFACWFGNEVFVLLFRNLWSAPLRWKRSNSGTSCEKLAECFSSWGCGYCSCVFLMRCETKNKLVQAGLSVIISAAYFAAPLLALFSLSAQQLPSRMGHQLSAVII